MVLRICAKYLFVAFLSCFFSVSSVTAQSDFEWGGFVSAGVVRSNSDSYYDRFIDDELNFLQDFRAGLNVVTPMTDQFSATIQLIARGRENDLRTMVEWGLITWQPVSEFSVQVGKIKMPNWLISDYLDVGLLYPWVRPPVEVYRWNPITAFLGGRAGYSFNLGVSNWNLNLEVYGGAADVNAPTAVNSIEGSGRDLVGGVVRLSNEEFLFRVSGARERLDLDLRSPTEVTDPATNLTSTQEFVTPLNLGTAKFLSAGFKMDYLDILIYSEMAGLWADEDGLIEHALGWYVTLGYYFWQRRILPHFTYAKVQENKSQLSPGTQWSTNLGIKYFLTDSVAVKFDWTHIRPENGLGVFQGQIPEEKVDIFASTLNMAF